MGVVIRVLSVKGQSNKSTADEKIGFVTRATRPGLQWLQMYCGTATPCIWMPWWLVCKAGTEPFNYYCSFRAFCFHRFNLLLTRHYVSPRWSIPYFGHLTHFLLKSISPTTNFQVCRPKISHQPTSHCSSTQLASPPLDIDTFSFSSFPQVLATLLSAIPCTARGPAQIVMFDIHALPERFYFSDQVIPR